MTSKEAKAHLKTAKTQMWTIPNIMSYFRLLLVPVFIILYVDGQGTGLL